MSEQRKKLLAFLGSFFILCSCCGGVAIWFGGTLSQIAVTEPAQARQIGREIATYTTPEDYAEILGLNFMRTKTIALAHENLATDTIIFMMQVPQAEGIAEAEVERQLLTMLHQFNPQPVTMEQDRVEKRMINGEEVDLIFNNGANEQGESFQQMLLFFRSNQGKVFLMAQGNADTWDQAMLDTFLESLK